MRSVGEHSFRQLASRILIQNRTRTKAENVELNPAFSTAVEFILEHSQSPGRIEDPTERAGNFPRRDTTD